MFTPCVISVAKGSRDIAKQNARNESWHSFLGSERCKSIHRNGFNEPVHVLVYRWKKLVLRRFSGIASLKANEHQPRVGTGGSAAGLHILRVVGWHSTNHHHIYPLKINSVTN